MTELSDYDYELPHQLIAQQPLAHRADARLLLVDRATKTIDHAHFRDLPEILRSTDCLVLNDTCVIPARILGRRLSTGGRWQGLFLDKDDRNNWKLLCKTRGKLHAGERIMLVDKTGQDAVTLRLLSRMDQGSWVASPETDEESYRLLERIGRVPLPHYIRRGESLPRDTDDYQTVYAEHLGSIAAPTAGLPFTKPMLAQLGSCGIEIEKVTLHVGVGTFRPITAQHLQDHRMHPEWCRLDASTTARLQAIRDRGGRIIAVGTTTMRTLETAALQGTIQPWEGETDLFIHSPFNAQAIDGLITNFHLPRSTLLVLVRTFGGDELMRRAYEEAIREEYRFFSYGDAMLIV